MIAANDYVDPMLPRMSAVQLRMLIAQAAGLLAHHDGAAAVRETLVRIVLALPPEIEGEARIPVNPNRIIADVALKHGLRLRDLTGPWRARPVVRARHEAMWELRQRTTLSLPRIAHFMGGRDHTTIIHGIRCHVRRMAERMAAE